MAVLRKLRPIPIVFAFIGWASSWGCAENSIRLGEEGADGGSGNIGFTPPPGGDASADAGPDVTAPQQILACIATECPDPFATCPPEDGQPAYKCGTDLSHDIKNCGACGNKCLTYKPLHMTSRCVDGACELECQNSTSVPEDRRNCNGEIDDGCEVDVLTDPKNCGACGKACAGDNPCIKGKCGCTPPSILCDGRCVNPYVDDENCGGCGIVCQPPSDACDPPPPFTGYGCVAGTCGHLKCAIGTADCNGDVSGPNKCQADGCEADVQNDVNNCGGCGIKCKPGEECIDEGFGRECAVPCSRFGKVLCNGWECVDLLTDVSNCGACGNGCPPPGPHQIQGCKKGVCDYECAPGYADCNGLASDGCETNLMAHPGNCGACGNRCDVAAGQPCVEGKCLMKACDDQETH